jgi:hypothetical protein
MKSYAANIRVNSVWSAAMICFPWETPRSYGAPRIVIRIQPPALSRACARVRVRAESATFLLRFLVIIVVIYYILRTNRYKDF